jgi:cellulase/cellobiase CelA1
MRTIRLLGYISASFAFSLLACAVEPLEDEELDLLDSALTSQDGSMSAEITFQSQWQDGYCADMTIKNEDEEQTSRWRVVIGLNGSTVTNAWNATLTASDGQISATNKDYNGTLGPRGSTKWGFCASGNGRPSLVSVGGSGNSGSSSSRGTG